MAPSEFAGNNANEQLQYKEQSSQEILHSSTNTLIECLIDVPEDKLELYIKNNEEGFVTKISSQVLDAKRQAQAFLNNTMKKIS